MERVAVPQGSDRDVQEVAAVMATDYVAKEKIVACTNCGMAPMRRDIAVKKLEALAQGAALARQKFD